MLIKNIKNDIFLCLGILCLAIIAFLIFKLNLKDGGYVNVIVGGKVTASYTLKEDINTVLITEKGNNTLVIKDGKAFIQNADCPDKICAEHKPISKTGETIVCLPHKLVIEITENEENDQP
jgi:hypothetical protein